MKLREVFCLFGIAAVLFTSCKKESASDPVNPPAAVDANGNLPVAGDADGACYSITTRQYYENTGSDHLDLYSAFAWFGKATAMKDAGAVSVNSTSLTNPGGLNYYWYMGLDELFPTASAEWNVEGSSANGIPGFTHTDNTAFPAGGDFTLPATVNINNGLNVSYAPVSNVLGVVYSIRGNKGQKNKAVANGGSSVSFTAAELAEVAYEHDGVAVSIMPVTATPVVINGKKIYFVKQFQYLREAKTL